MRLCAIKAPLDPVSTSLEPLRGPEKPLAMSCGKVLQKGLLTELCAAIETSGPQRVLAEESHASLKAETCDQGTSGPCVSHSEALKIR